MIVIIPSNRKIKLDYFTPLIESGARFIVVDDTEGSIRVDHPQFRVYNWNDKNRMLGMLNIGFPKKNGACRDFGFYLAWKEAEPEEIIIALDDDCQVYHPDFALQAEKILSSDSRPVVSAEGEHLNILELYRDMPDHLFPRGFPYSARVGYKGMTVKEPIQKKVTCSLGLWKNIFDINAIDKIQGPSYCFPDARLKYASVIIEKSKLISVCSMNMIFRKEIIPVVYQLPMHVEVAPGWVIDRFGDIWGGFILKMLMDIKGEGLAAGEPMINHLRDGNYLRNLWQEHVCHLVNDEFIDLMKEAGEAIRPTEYLDMMAELNEGLKDKTGGASALLKPYLAHLTVAMDAWIKALQ